MANPQMTDREIERIIFDRCRRADVSINSVTVTPSKVYGWEANFLAGPSVVSGFTWPRVPDAIVQEVRAAYDLKKD